MRLCEALEIRRGVTAIIGSGGKTSLMLALGHELSREARVIVCTTTHIFPPEGMPCLLSPDTEALRHALAQTPLVCAASQTDAGKLSAPEIPFSVLQTLADYVLVEADGSRRLPVKAHASHEPVVPPEANQTIAVLGLTGLGRPVRETAHRPELYAQRLGVSMDEIVTPELAARLLQTEALHTRVFLNQADTPELTALGRRAAAGLSCPVCIGSLQKGEIVCLY